MKHTSTEHILETLRTRGYRITSARRAIVDALETTSSPYTVQDIVARIHTADQVSVYRLFKTLHEEGLLATVPSKGETMYELKGEHHHHIVCTACGHTTHIPCTTTRTFPTPSQHTFHTITDHDVTFYGTCMSCATPTKKGY